MNLDLFIKTMKEVSEDKFNETISKGALRLDDAQINTVSFMFWLCYMAEIDLESVLTEAWRISSTHFPPEVSELAKSSLKEMVLGKRDLKLDDAITGLSPEIVTKIKAAVEQGYLPKRDFDIENLEYFTDKIKVYEAMFGKNDRSKLLWKINTLRNQISHNRIEELKYEGTDLKLRSAKEKILSDYMRTSFTQDFTQTDIWKGLSEEQKREIEAMYQGIKKNM